jgi:hypothetical protein
MGIRHKEKGIQEINGKNWPDITEKVERACKEIMAQEGTFELRRGCETARARGVVKFVNSIADKHSVNRGHLFNVYFGR